jgi:membrane-anchored mycosin MYCP
VPRLSVGLILAPLLLAGVLVVPATLSPAAAVEPVLCEQSVPDRIEVQVSDGRGNLPGKLRLDEAHAIADGEGVGVAVVDTGTHPGGDPGAAGSIPLSPGHQSAGTTRLYDAHGTFVGGLIAGSAPDGALGVAPGAHVTPIRVLDAGADVSTTEDGLVRDVSPAAVAAAIRWVVDNPGSPRIRVINLSLNFAEPHPTVAAEIERAIDAGIVVVASVGNRPAPPQGAEPGDYAGAYQQGEDRVQFPATVDGVLGVTALDEDDTLNPEQVLTGPDVDVSAPVVGAMTVNVGGTTCVLQEPATSWAAAEVSGLAALVIDRFGPAITPAEVVTRIEATAQGAYADSALDGHGMIQPVEALTARLAFNKDGSLKQQAGHTEPQRDLELPPPSEDAYAGPRRTLMWWGLGAGGALLAALLLRPLTARRRR